MEEACKWGHIFLLKKEMGWASYDRIAQIAMEDASVVNWKSLEKSVSARTRREVMAVFTVVKVNWALDVHVNCGLFSKLDNGPQREA